MAGEMFRDEVTRENYPMYFAIADALGGSVEPFDQYQGPYIALGPNLRVGSEPYSVPLNLPGAVRLWLVPVGDDGDCAVYNEAADKTSSPFWPYWQDDAIACELAVGAAHEVVAT